MLLNKFNMERYKVGEVFEYEGMVLKTIEDDLKQEESGCKYCALNKFMCSHIDCGTRMNPSVRFVEVSKEAYYKCTSNNPGCRTFAAT